MAKNENKIKGGGNIYRMAREAKVSLFFIVHGLSRPSLAQQILLTVLWLNFNLSLNLCYNLLFFLISAILLILKTLTSTEKRLNIPTHILVKTSFLLRNNLILNHSHHLIRQYLTTRLLSFFNPIQDLFLSLLKPIHDILLSLIKNLFLAFLAYFLNRILEAFFGFIKASLSLGFDLGNDFNFFELFQQFLLGTIFFF